MARIAAFETHSDAYDQWFAEHPAEYAAELAALRRLLPAEGRGLEIGIGSGRFARPLGIREGVEPSPRMARKARALGLKVHAGVAERLPFAAARFDFALMVTTICFVDDLKQSLCEARRVLKHGGCLLVAFVDKDSDLGRRYQANREQSRFYREATFYATPEVLETLRAAGFGSLDTVQTLLPDPRQQSVVEGYGEGAFVVIRAANDRETE